MPYYPTLAAEMARKGITKKDLSDSLGICFRSISNKLSGRVPFTWDEVCLITSTFFPDMEKDVLFARAEQDTA